MGGRTGDVSGNIFDARKRTVAELQQQGVPRIDRDINDVSESQADAARRPIQSGFNRQFVADSFNVIGTGSANDFDLDGNGASFADPDSWGRGWIEGWGCLLSEDPRPFVPTGFPTTEQQRDELYHVSTGLTATVLTDTSTLWVVNELVGRTLFPNADSATGQVITANTATTITTAGDHTVVASVGDYYRIGLTTPSGSDRLDGVYLDVYIDEIDSVEDPDLLHPVGTGLESSRRLRVIQQIRVREDVTANGELVDFTDSDSNRHYVEKLAILDRDDGDPNISASMVTDLRDPNFGSGPEVVLARGTTTSLDTRLDVALEEDGTLKSTPFDNHRDEQHSNGIVGGITSVVPSLPVGQDKVELTDVQAGEKLFVDGKDITALTATEITFVGVVTKTLWNLFIDNVGVPTRSRRIDYTGINITGVDIVEVSPNTASAVGKQLVFTQSSSSLVWDGGPSVVIAVNDGRQVLYDSGGVNFIVVNVTSGLPITDATDTVDIDAAEDLEANYFIGFAHHNGTIIIDESISLDKRVFGTLSQLEISTDVLGDKNNEDRLIRVASAAALGDGVIHGFDSITGIGGTLYTVPGGRALINGKVVSLASTTVASTSGVTITEFVFLKEVNGGISLTVSQIDPRLQAFPFQFRFALLAVGTTDGGGNIASITDARAIPSRFADVFQPGEDGKLGGSPTFTGGPTIDTNDLVFTGGAEITGQVIDNPNIKPDAVTTSEILDGTILEADLSSSLISVIKDPVQNRVLPLAPFSQILYEPEISAPFTGAPSTTTMLFHSFPLIINGVLVPGVVASPSATTRFTLDLDTAAHRTVDSVTVAKASNTWYNIYAEKVSSTIWEPRLAAITDSPDYFGVHPNNADFRWIGTVRTRATAQTFVLMYKMTDGTVMFYDQRDSIDIGGWDFVIFDEISIPATWTSVVLGTTSLNLLPPTTKQAYFALEMNTTGAGDDLRDFFAPDGTFTGSAIGGLALRSAFSSLTTAANTSHFWLMTDDLQGIQYRRGGTDGGDQILVVEGYREPGIF